MAQQTVDAIDSLNTGRVKINENFTEVYAFGTYAAWVPTFTGFASTPTGYTARYTKIGKTCHFYLTMTGSENSNTNGFTITLPFTSANTVAQYGTITSVVDNGGSLTTPGRIIIAVNSNVATLTKDSAGGVWAASGIKRANFHMTYETA